MKKTAINENFFPVFESFKNQEHSLYLLGGGRGRGASHFIRTLLGYLLKGGFGYKNRILLVRTTKSSIKKSIFQGAIDILNQMGIDKSKLDKLDLAQMEMGYNGHTILVDSFITNSMTTQKMKSYVDITHVFIEELQELTDPFMFNQLITTLRSFINQEGQKIKVQIVCAFNTPDKSHWITRNFFELKETKYEGFYLPVFKEETANKLNAMFNFSTVYDNGAWLEQLYDIGGQEYVDQKLYLGYERYLESDPYIYYTETLGLVASGRAGRIYTNWEEITDQQFEEVEAMTYYGLDFGFTHDPTACVAVKRKDDKIYLKDIFYGTGMSETAIYNRIVDLIPEHYNHYIYADGQEARLISSLESRGVNIIAANKGKNSRKDGVEFIKTFQVYYVPSENLKKEVETYSWAVNRNGEPLNVPADGGDHLLDAFRYCVFSKWHASNMTVWDSLYSDSGKKLATANTFL